MQKLHLVGFTTDQKGLILSARRGARSGGFHLPLDDALAEAVEELRARQDEAEVEEPEDLQAVRVPRVESALPVREIQARLRQGRSVSEVARAAGVEPAWVERFAAPVFAEQAQVVSKVQGMALRRPRLGPSSHTIGDAVRRNLADRGVASSPEELASGWTTRQLADGRWSVRFSFRHRNQDKTLRFDLDESTGAVTAATPLSGQLGYVAPPPASEATATPRPRPSRPGREDQPTAKRATVTTGFRPDEPSTPPTSRPAKERERATQAMRRAASRRAVDGERAAARKVKEKEAATRRTEREAKAEEARQRRERRAAEKAKAAAARAKAAAARRAAAARERRRAERQAAAQAKRAEAALRAAERTRVAARAAVRKAAAREAAAATATKARRATAKKAVAKEATAKKATAKTATTKKAVAKKATAKKPVTKKAVRARKAPAAPRPAAAATTRPGRPASPRTPAHMATAEPSAARPVVTQTRLAVRLRDAQLAEPANGMAPPLPLDRPRRTRPLRAT